MARPPKADRSAVADSTLTLRLTHDQRALLDELVKHQAAELADAGMEPTAASYVRGLIAREAKSKGIVPAKAPEPIAPAERRKPRASKTRGARK